MKKFPAGTFCFLPFALAKQNRVAKCTYANLGSFYESSKRDVFDWTRLQITFMSGDDLLCALVVSTAIFFDLIFTLHMNAPVHSFSFANRFR